MRRTPLTAGRICIQERPIRMAEGFARLQGFPKKETGLKARFVMATTEALSH